MPSSFGMVNPLIEPIRDRAARLRSSEKRGEACASAQHLKSGSEGEAYTSGILDTKNRDVVAEQLKLF